MKDARFGTIRPELTITAEHDPISDDMMSGWTGSPMELLGARPIAEAADSVFNPSARSDRSLSESERVS